MVATILVSTYDYIDSSGSAIQCLFDKGTGIPNPVVNRYCWIMSTFTLPKHFKGTEGEDFLHYGVGKWIFLCYLAFICCIIRAPFTYLKINLSCSIPCLQKFFFSLLKRSNNWLHFFYVMPGKNFGLLFFSLTSDWLFSFWICVFFFLVPGAHREEDERVYHAYYQWVPIVLTLQAIAFYAPHWIWKQLEGGRLTKIVCGLDQKINDDGDRTQKVTQLRFEKLPEFDIFLPKID